MSQKQLKDMAASVRQRLQNRARDRGEDFQLTLIQYALERLLYRLSQSKWKDQFVLKGALLLSAWGGTPYRATRDMDLHGRGSNDVKELESTFGEICRTSVEHDGLEFVLGSIHGEVIAEDQEYQGVRLSFEARLGAARIPIQVDIGFGDALQPRPAPLDYPTMLDFPAPNILSYQRETVVAEKYQAMIVLGIANSRMKDFFDIWFLARQFPFDGPRLCEAIQATFSRRQTPLPSTPPLCLTPEFSKDRAKETQWRAFVKKTGLTERAASLDDVIGVLAAFLLPPTKAVVEGRGCAQHWPAGGPWKSGTEG